MSILKHSSIASRRYSCKPPTVAWVRAPCAFSRGSRGQERDDAAAEARVDFGDNLLALKALEPAFTGRIRCIYVDPPFNTGHAFERYGAAGMTQRVQPTG